MIEFRPGQSADAANSAIKVAISTMDKAKHNAVVWFGEILERKLYLELGYSSINQYAQQELGFSSSRVGDFLNISNRLKKLPQLEEEVNKGEIGYTSLRELVRVASPETEEGWVDFAKNNSRRDLEREVKRAKKEAADKKVGQPSLIPLPEKRPVAAPPVRVSMEMSPTQFARYEALWQAVRKTGAAPADKVEALLEALACYVAESSPRGDVVDGVSTNEINAGSAVGASYGEQPNTGGEGKNRPSAPPCQIHIHQCPDCQKATVQTSKGELELAPADLAQAQCDCKTAQPGHRNTSAIAPSVRRQVLSRDRHRCRRPGCHHTRFLEVHHVVPRAQGGGNEAENLITLCSACHSLVHSKENLAREWATFSAEA